MTSKKNGCTCLSLSAFVLAKAVIMRNAPFYWSINIAFWALSEDPAEPSTVLISLSWQPLISALAPASNVLRPLGRRDQG
jgi:hypothetical protein